MNAWLLGYSIVAAVFALGWFVYCLRTSPAPPLAALMISVLAGAAWPFSLGAEAFDWLRRRCAK